MAYEAGPQKRYERRRGEYIHIIEIKHKKEILEIET